MRALALAKIPSLIPRASGDSVPLAPGEVHLGYERRGLEEHTWAIKLGCKCPYLLASAPVAVLKDTFLFPEM